MSTEFSEESRLLVGNWSVVQEIHRAEANLGSELRKFLFSVESRLNEAAWWDSGWVFRRYRDDQIYIARSEWLRNDKHVMWIGVEGFTPDALFGSDSCATLYVWVLGKHAQLAQSLSQTLMSDEDVVTKEGSRYVVKTSLRKCLPEELDTFAQVIGDPILDFMERYASMHESFTQALVAGEE